MPHGGVAGASGASTRQRQSPCETPRLRITQAAQAQGGFTAAGAAAADKHQWRASAACPCGKLVDKPAQRNVYRGTAGQQECRSGKPFEWLSHVYQ